MSEARKAAINGAPSEFHHSSFLLGVSNDYSVAVEKCPICRNGKYPLYCSECVLREKLDIKTPQERNGGGNRQLLFQPKNCSNNNTNNLAVPAASYGSGLAHSSKSLGNDERIQRGSQASGVRCHSFQEGCDHQRELQVRRNELEVQINNKMVEQYSRDDKKLRMEKLHERLKILKKSLDSQTEECKEKTKQLARSKEENRQRAKRLASMQKKLPSKINEAKLRRQKMEGKLKKLNGLENESMVRRLQIVKDIEKWIFKVEPIPCYSSDSDESRRNVASQIADAFSHQYVKGAWAYVDTPKDFQYKITGARFYASGECVELKQYIEYSSEHKLRSSACRNVHGELAALSHISQFVQCMASTLDVHVPYMTYIPLLNLNTASPDDLANFIAQVNMNLAFLSASQGVDMRAYQPRRTIANLFHLINNDTIGRSQSSPLIMTSQLQSVQDEINKPCMYGPLPGEQPEDSNYVIVTESPITTSSEMSAATTSYAASAASSIMTSAVSAVSSIWPWK